MTTQDNSLHTQSPAEDMATYLISVAEQLQAQVDDTSSNMNKKLEEMTKRIETLERNLKQMEELPQKPEETLK